MKMRAHESLREPKSSRRMKYWRTAEEVMKLISLIHCEIVVYNVEWGHLRSGSASLGSKWGRIVVTMRSCGPKVRPEFKSWPQLVAKQVKWCHQSTPERILFRLRYLIYDLIRYSGQNVVSSYICPTASFLLTNPISFSLNVSSYLRYHIGL